MMQPEWIPIVESFIQKSDLIIITPTPQGLIDVGDMLKMEKILISSLIKISKSIE
jgi:hypothetical protein